MKFSQWLSLIVLVVCLYILWQIRNVLLLGLTAIIFAVVLNQATRFLHRWIRSRKIAVATVLVTVISALVIFGFLIIPPFSRQLQELVNLIPQIINQLQASINQLQQSPSSKLSPSTEILNGIANQLQSLSLNMETLFARFYRIFSNTLTLTINILLIAVLTIMLLVNPSPYRKLFTKAFPASMRQRIWKVMDECESDITGWFTGILFNMGVIAGMSMIGLWILGVPLAFANGLLAGLLAFIPNIGPVLSVVPPAAIALLSSPWQAVTVVVLYILIQQIESNILTPLVMQKQVSLLPGVTLLSQVMFAVFFGFLGLLLALPLTLIIQNWLEEFWVKGFLEQH